MNRNREFDYVGNALRGLVGSMALLALLGSCAVVFRFIGTQHQQGMAFVVMLLSALVLGALSAHELRHDTH